MKLGRNRNATYMLVATTIKVSLWQAATVFRNTFCYGQCLMMYIVSVASGCKLLHIVNTIYQRYFSGAGDIDMHCGAGFSNAVLHFGQGMSEKGDVSLSLLNAIDGTVDWLAGIEKEASGGLALGAVLLKKLPSCNRAQPLDPDGEMRNLYVQAEDKQKEVIELLSRKRRAAQLDPRLSGHHLDTLIGEFTNAIEAIAQLHDLLVELRWAVAEHDADLEAPAGKPCSSAEEFFRTLSS